MDFHSGVEHIKRLATGEDASALEMGDVVLALVPVGADGVRNGSGDDLQELADATGVAVATLRERRFVANRIAPAVRTAGVAWSVYLTLAKVKNEAEREELLRKVAETRSATPSGRWTVDAVRALTGKVGTRGALAARIEAAPPEERQEAYEILRDDPAVAPPPLPLPEVAVARGALRLAVFVLDARVAAQHYAQALAETELEAGARATEAAAVDTVLRAWERLRLLVQAPGGPQLVAEVEAFLADVRT